MKLKLELTKAEVRALIAVIGQAEEVATVMFSSGKEGGQMKDGNELMLGCKLIGEIIQLASK